MAVKRLAQGQELIPEALLLRFSFTEHPQGPRSFLLVEINSSDGADSGASLAQVWALLPPHCSWVSRSSLHFHSIHCITGPLPRACVT